MLSKSYSWLSEIRSNIHSISLYRGKKTPAFSGATVQAATAYTPAKAAYQQDRAGYPAMHSHLLENYQSNRIIKSATL